MEKELRVREANMLKRLIDILSVYNILSYDEALQKKREIEDMYY